MESTKRVSVHIKLSAEFLEVMKAEKGRAEDNREHLPVGLQERRRPDRNVPVGEVVARLGPTFVGGRANATLARRLSRDLDAEVTSDKFAMRFPPRQDLVSSRGALSRRRDRRDPTETGGDRRTPPLSSPRPVHYTHGQAGGPDDSMVRACGSAVLKGSAGSGGRACQRRHATLGDGLERETAAISGGRTAGRDGDSSAWECRPSTCARPPISGLLDSRPPVTSGARIPSGPVLS
jgi:hypothetical protein